MQTVALDHTDRRILEWLQKEPGINASELGERIGLSQSAVWRRIQSLREEGVIRDQPVKIDREKVGLNTMVFAHVKLTSHGRSNLAVRGSALRCGDGRQSLAARSGEEDGRHADHRREA